MNSEPSPRTTFVSFLAQTAGFYPSFSSNSSGFLEDLLEGSQEKSQLVVRFCFTGQAISKWTMSETLGLSLPGLSLVNQECATLKWKRPHSWLIISEWDDSLAPLTKLRDCCVLLRTDLQQTTPDTHRTFWLVHSLGWTPLQLPVSVALQRTTLLPAPNAALSADTVLHLTLIKASSAAVDGDLVRF